MGYARPGCLRPLFPFLIFPQGPWAEKEKQPYLQWGFYQALRFGTLWAALAISWTALGPLGSIVAAGLLGLTFKFDYWSNAIEFLGACAVFAGLPWPLCLALGLVLGFGRETLPFLILTGTPGGIALGGGAAVATLALRRFTKRDPQWDQAERDLEYSRPQWRRNLAVLRGLDPPAYIDVAIYLAIAGLALLGAPLLTVALVGTTLMIARMDEPRVLTMLVPWAAAGLIRWP